MSCRRGDSLDETQQISSMAWDPAVLRKYNTTGHFRLINQVRSELKDNPLVRPKEGQSVGEANRSKSLTRALEARSGSPRSRRSIAAMAAPELPYLMETPSLETSNSVDGSDAGTPGSFRDRLNAIELR